MKLLCIATQYEDGVGNTVEKALQHLHLSPNVPVAISKGMQAPGKSSSC